MPCLVMAGYLTLGWGQNSRLVAGNLRLQNNKRRRNYEGHARQCRGKSLYADFPKLIRNGRVKFIDKTVPHVALLGVLTTLHSLAVRTRNDETNQSKTYTGVVVWQAGLVIHTN